jgi:glycosyltransferase involved in cell wall biosynthesis
MNTKYNGILQSSTAEAGARPPMTEPNVVIIADETPPGSNSLYWFDHLESTSCAWRVIRSRAQQTASVFLIGNLRHLRSAHTVMTLHNRRSTQMLLLLKKLRLLRSRVVVLELNIKEESLGWWNTLIGKWVYREADLVTVLAPCDQSLLATRLALAGNRVAVVEQWAQPDRFTDQEPTGLPWAPDRLPAKFGLAAGRSSRNFDELFQAAAMLPDVSLLLVGCDPRCIPASLAGRVHGVGTMPFENYIWLLRRARFSLIPLRPVAHTCGLRVWLQSLAVGTPVIVTGIESVAHYFKIGTPARLYPPGDIAQLSEHMRVLWSDDAACRQMSDAGRRMINGRLSPEFFHERISKLLMPA